MELLTDIHHHLVFGVDDGSKSVEMSMDMVRAASRQGISDIVCTAHTIPGHHELDVDQYIGNFSDLENRIQKEKIPVKLIPGAEIMYTEKTLKTIKSGISPRLGYGNYVLVEFLPDVPFDLMQSAIGEITYSDIGVVLSHVERYNALSDMSRIAELRDSYEVAIQMNASAVLTAGKLLPVSGIRIHRMLKEHLVDVVASDAHNDKNRACNLRAAYDFLCEKYGKEYALEICRTRPMQILGLDSCSERIED